MRFAKRFQTVEEAAAFRRRVSNNKNFKTFSVNGSTVVMVPKDTDLKGGWAEIKVPPCGVTPEYGKETFCQDGIPTYGMWF